MNKVKKLNNGMRLLLIPMQNLYTVSIGVMVDVGSIKEDSPCNGYSHLIEHLMFKGTPTRNATDISREMDEIGAQMNAYTAKDETCYWTRTVPSDMEKCLDVLSDIYFNATFPEDEIEREKQVVIEEILMGEDMPDELCHDHIAEAIFSKQQLGQTIVGSVENINNSTRHSILEFKEKHYYPSNTVITVSGKFDEDTICALIEKYFDKEVKETEHISESVSEVKYTSQHIVIYKSVEQSHISLAFPACSMQDKMREACLLMSVILGGGLSSRLFTSIREVNGLAYNVFSQLSSYVNGGYLEIYIGTSPNKVKKSCELLSSELSKFLADGVTLAELDSAKAQTINSLIMSKESGLQIMTSLSRSLMKLNKLNDVDDKISRLASITVKDVNDAIKLVFNNAFATTYVGKKTQYSDCVEKIIL